MNEFWIHLDATKELVRRLRAQVLSGSSGEHFINISYFLRILSDSTDINILPTPWFPDTGRASPFIGDGHTLEYTYGITAKLAGFLGRACALARNAAYYKSRDCVTPEGFMLACDELLDDLSEWHISQEPLESFSNTGDITTLLASKHILAFAEGIRVYYHTRVDPCDQPAMKSLVDSIASHLTGIEDIKRRTGYDATPTATIPWPGFMASCQAKPPARDVWVKWWTQMLDYRIGNIHGLWFVVREVWSLQDAGVEDNPPWAAVLKRTGRKILAI